MFSTMTITVLIVITVLIFDFINGFHDTATAVATSITTRALKPQTAIVICAIFNFIGAFSGTAVAKTVGENIVSHNSMPQWVILGVLISAIIWNIITWYFGIPSSSSHALIGALVGGGIAYNLKFDVVNWYNLFHDVVIWIFIAPIIGFTVGYILMILLNWILKPFKPGIINKIFLKLQVVAGSLMALNHGSNDAQKSMGLITMALLSGGLISTFEVPTWVIACCAIAMALGTASGGKKIIKTMGSGMAKLTPVNGFAAQTGGAAVIFLATLFHAPVSTTHIISTTVMGVGASKRIKSVKWGVAQNIVWAWILTIPITAALSAFIIFIAKLFI
ncbi:MULTISPECIES: inorganic phosphate transporter [Clostridium]|jgi:Phosphate/sulphate permeases|uniref:Inorganic phosphate transporter n=4 Tax=Clostridium TaxID=1485 RepID=A0A0B5QKT4_CLOBE|nr:MULTISPECIES: inorganic phosphate transporter [Clostridium]ABR33947.1 phosphate transporter [Clostridium beijerinckii NCIMB 8052]AIU03091.1 phosphate transporter [Clostridium beijerinckii ATCC 35702]AJG98517.1 inorganic phosphate transporter [Clostridium beijerinckii]ALB47027.1 inorganic phosphate transporter [Clostridium beijerinckii NRRL B-598]AQS04394.1 Low-affinity inorganic phosphate transporter 1 [Clostridium beijerinckii]